MAVLETWKHSSVPTMLLFCLEADVKPTTDSRGTAIPAGSESIETDTGDRYIFNGTSWTQIQPPSTDNATYVNTVITYSHHQVHEGNRFVVNDVQNVSTTTMKWQITTPDSLVYTHLFLDIEGTGEISVVVTEGSDRTDGTALAEINRNRVGTPASANTIVTRTPTGGSTDGATTIFAKRGGATSQGSKTLEGGGLRGENEFVLKPNTKYVVSVETFANIYVSFRMNWYEHNNKE